eukprot:SAG31_NODE_20371_length_576_cov_1.301887_1_plen_61_part_01
MWSTKLYQIPQQPISNENCHCNRYFVKQDILAEPWPELHMWPILLQAKGVLEKGYPDIKTE